MKEDIYSLPIDQYSRQYRVAQIIDAQRKNNQSFKILDVGGYKGKTTLFQKNDEVTVCDLFDVKEKNYVRTDGRKLPFEDKSFDFVVSFDTYEHVPKEHRRRFIKEINRVADIAAIVAAPFEEYAGGWVSRAEIALNNYHKLLYNKDHRWLKEHIDFKTPSNGDFEKILKNENITFSTLKTNDIDIWVCVQIVYFSIMLDQDLRGRVDDLNREFNKNIELYDSAPARSYRSIYALSKSESIHNFINKNNKFKIDVKKEKSDFISLVLTTFGVKYRDVVSHNKYLESEVHRLLKENSELIEQNEQIRSSHRKLIKYLGPVHKLALKTNWKRGLRNKDKR